MMGFFKSSPEPQPAEVTKQTVQMCIYAIVAVGIAAILATGLEMLQQVLFAHKYGEGIFAFSTIRAMFRIVADHVLIVAACGLLAWFIHKRLRDAAVASIGLCLAQVAATAIPFFRSLINAAGSDLGILRVLENLLPLGVSAAALGVLVILIRRWPSQTTPQA